MDLTLSTSVDILEIKDALTKNFSNYKVKHPLLNKKALNVIDKSTMIIIFPKGNKIKIINNLNIMHSWYFIVFIILLFFTFIGGFIFYGILWYTKKEERKMVENEVTSFINDHYV